MFRPSATYRHAREHTAPSGRRTARSSHTGDLGASARSNKATGNSSAFPDHCTLYLSLFSWTERLGYTEAVATFNADNVPVEIIFDLVLEEVLGWQIDRLRGTSGDTDWNSEDWIAAATTKPDRSYSRRVFCKARGPGWLRQVHSLRPSQLPVSIRVLKCRKFTKDHVDPQSFGAWMRLHNLHRVPPACSKVTFVGEEAKSIAVCRCLALLSLVALVLAVASLGTQVLPTALADLGTVAFQSTLASVR